MDGQDIEFRRADAGDVATIRAITRAAYAQWVALIGREPRPMTADYAAAILRDRFDLACVDGVAAGVLQTLDEGDVLLVENLAVDPAYQRRGLGRALMARAEVLARRLGRDRLRLYTNARFVDNIQLYGRLGYGVDRTEDLGFGVAVHMSKALGDPASAWGPGGVDS